MNFIKKMIYCWRYGQLSGLLLKVLRIGYILLAFFSVILFWNNSSFNWSRIVLIDVLFGLPIVVVFLLVLSIIWQGIIKSFACVLGKMQFLIDESEDIDNNERA